MGNQSDILLTPAQQRTLDNLQQGLSTGDIIVLKGKDGFGKSIILQKLHEIAGGELVGARQFMHNLESRPPAAMEEAFLDMVTSALERSDLVIVDDLHLVSQVDDNYYYPRKHLLDAALTALFGEARSNGRKFVFSVEDDMPWPLSQRCYAWKIGAFEPEDYQCIGRAFLGESAEGLDFEQIHRFAPELSARQLANSFLWLRREATLDTDRLIEYLRSHYMKSNVDLSEVRQVTFADLKGVDDVIRELEAKIALPFENDELRQELKLKPKRGVLLAGPPGTGKTTIGRALAHRLKSKFFLIDGTVVAGSECFYSQVNAIFEAAKKNAPAIIFIDDADVIFENGDEKGFCRYLLTMLDGLESASAERVCVMLTAMHPGNLPQAMLRSGRVELWLEVGLPDEAARFAILDDKLAQLPDSVRTIDVRKLAEASHGLTGADLKNVVDDAMLTYAHDRLAGNPLAINEYFVMAIASIRANRRRYATSRPPKLAEPVDFGFKVLEPAIY